MKELKGEERRGLVNNNPLDYDSSSAGDKSVASFNHGDHTHWLYPTDYGSYICGVRHKS